MVSANVVEHKLVCILDVIVELEEEIFVRKYIDILVWLGRIFSEEPIKGAMFLNEEVGSLLLHTELSAEANVLMSRCWSLRLSSWFVWVPIALQTLRFIIKLH